MSEPAAVESPSKPVPEESKQISSSPLPELAAPLDLHCSPPNVSSQSVESTPDTNNESRESKKSPSDGTTPVKNRRKRKPNVTKKVSTADVPDTDTDLINIDIESDLKTNFISCRTKANTDSDCETIDKIAQMVSTITSTAPLVVVTEPKKSSVDVIEDQLEQMFADPEEAQALPAVLSVPVTDDVPAEPAKEVKKKKILTKPRKKKSDGVALKKQAQAVVGGKLKNGKVPGKRGRKPASEDTKSDAKGKTKENGKSKVKADVAPFVLVQKDGSFAIVNQIANGDDDAEKTVNKPKKMNTDKHNKHKAMRGLHVSTLSNKYDADKRDATWVCVFCKLGPHKHKLGDLFGPYIVSTTSKEYENCLQDPASDIFRQSNKNKFAKVVSPPTSPEKTKKKRKLNDSKATTSADVTNEELFNGMSKVDDINYEVWFHEDCIVWCNGVYTIGTKIVGMEAAIWLSTRYRCAYCEKNGAVVSCLSRECRKPAHIRCARAGWKLDDEFKTFCELHH